MKFNWQKIGGVLVILFFLFFISGLLYFSHLIRLSNEIDRDIYKIEYAMELTKIKSCSLMCQNKNLSYFDNHKSKCDCSNDNLEIESFILIINNDIAGYYLDEYKRSSPFTNTKTPEVEGILVKCDNCSYFENNSEEESEIFFIEENLFSNPQFYNITIKKSYDYYGKCYENIGDKPLGINMEVVDSDRNIIFECSPSAREKKE